MDFEKDVFSCTPSYSHHQRTCPCARTATASADASAEGEELTRHPAKKNMMNFMRVIIVDSLSLLSSPKNPPVIDLLIDADPPHTTEKQRSLFQTEMLGVIMDHLLAADVLIGDQAALPVVNGGNSQYIPPNVFYLASRYCYIIIFIHIFQVIKIGALLSK